MNPILGKLSWFLGIKFECENSTIKTNQSRYIEKILSKFGMADCKPHLPSYEMNIKKTSDEDDLIDCKTYRVLCQLNKKIVLILISEKNFLI